MDGELIARFASIVGDRHALTEPDMMRAYLTEPRGLYPGTSPLVLRPGSVAEVSAIMRLATETGTPIVPQGGNTGLVGGQMPDQSDKQVVLSLGRLDRIREIDPVSNTVTVEAGVILQKLHEAVDAVDRLYPLSLASQGSCQIGGNLSSNAGGVAVLSYGNTRELCLGLEVVMPNGDVFDDLRKLKKDNTGYDLKDLFIGAEGTLGVITATVLKLFPKPLGREVAYAAVPSPEAALQLLNLGLEKAGGALTSFELIEATPLRFLKQYMPQIDIPLGLDWRWRVLVEVSSGRSAEDARGLIEDILSAGMEGGLVLDAVLATNLRQAEAFWSVREDMPDAQKMQGASIKHDISVPVAAVPTLISQAEALVQRVCPGARVCCFGHMGDGNLHYNVSQPVGMDPAAFLALYQPMNEAIYALVAELGGSFSAEHGIGIVKRDYLQRTGPAVGLTVMRAIKAALDPAGIMNPGKVM